jgi:hypothetical protein
VVGVGVTPWAVEDIPDGDTLYMRGHRQFLKPDGSLSAACFRNRPDDSGGMSTDWERYSTPEDTRNRARGPMDNAVIALNVGQVRMIPDQVVQHSPVFGHPDLPDNRAHTDILGSKEHDPEVRRRFQRIAIIVLSLSESPR